ncbi:MAG: hypothetical protein M0Z30_12145 [Actinomycetota bacterium]|nr:hypothetical protein [Actinomycetota bacterium]
MKHSTGHVLMALISVLAVAAIWRDIATCHPTPRTPPVRAQYPLFTTARCNAATVFTWLDEPAPGGGYQPILCGGAPPSDTGNWGANLPAPGATSAAAPAVVRSAPAAIGCPADFCNPSNPNPAVPVTRSG